MQSASVCFTYTVGIFFVSKNRNDHTQCLVDSWEFLNNNIYIHLHKTKITFFNIIIYMKLV